MLIAITRGLKDNGLKSKVLFSVFFVVGPYIGDVQARLHPVVQDALSAESTSRYASTKQ